MEFIAPLFLVGIPLVLLFVLDAIRAELKSIANELANISVELKNSDNRH